MNNGALIAASLMYLSRSLSAQLVLELQPRCSSCGIGKVGFKVLQNVLTGPLGRDFPDQAGKLNYDAGGDTSGGVEPPCAVELQHRKYSPL